MFPVIQISEMNVKKTEVNERRLQSNHQPTQSLNHSLNNSLPVWGEEGGRGVDRNGPRVWRVTVGGSVDRANPVEGLRSPVDRPRLAKGLAS